MECYMDEIERKLDYKRWACGGFEGVYGDEGRVRGVFLLKFVKQNEKMI